MRVPQPTCVDFETFGIEGRPLYPPFPVGVSIKEPGKPARYYAWGHREANNCRYSEGRAALEKAWKNPDGILCHNSKFDYDIATTHMGMPELNPLVIHDTVYLLFLDNPHAKNLGLKPSAERLLGMKPEERDAVEDWLITVQPIPGIRIGRGKNAKEPAGKYIAYAPGDLVGTYANGDTDRTEQIFKKLWKSVCVDRAMLEPYQREQRLMPALLQSERRGVRVDLPRLRHDTAFYGRTLARLDEWIRAGLGNPMLPDPKRGGELAPLNIDAAQPLARALIAAGKADPRLMGVTAKGAIATNKAAVEAGVTDRVMAGVLTYRAQLSTCYGTFLTVWLAMAERSGGWIYTSWNQTKGERGGTRTGRLSSSPNFQNIPKEFQPIFEKDVFPAELKRAEYAYLIGRKCPFKDLPPLPLCRSYIIPMQPNHVLIDRDYAQQEPRVLAHFEDGVLKRQYIENPKIDFHNNARDYIEEATKKKYDRRSIKITNLAIIYGRGVGSTAEALGLPVEEAKDLRELIYNLYPGLRDLYKEMRRRARNRIPIRTWGGREYYCEEPIKIGDRLVTFDYKMVNVLIQGSAADCTKEAFIRLFLEIVRRRKHNSWFMLLQVHDSITLSVPKEDFEEAMAVMRSCMESVEFDVPMLSDGSWSATNWAELQDYDKLGEIISAKLAA